jgi:hypothetical protein
MKTTLLASILALALFSGCKKSDSSCEAIYDHTLSLLPDELKKSTEDHKSDAIAKCEKMSPEARQCAADAKSVEDLMKCPHK